MELDLEASLQLLAEWPATCRKSGWSPTPEREALRDLAQTLDRVVETRIAHVEALDRVVRALQDSWGSGLEYYVDGEIDATGNPTRADGHPGRFVSAANQAAETAELLRADETNQLFREIAEKARTLADALPHPLAKPELADAADVFLRLWYEAGRDRPTLTGWESGPPDEAVLAFHGVLEKAGAYGRIDSTRKLLTKALQRSDPHCGTEWLRFAVWR